MKKFDRFELLVGSDGLKKIKNKHILIVGIGGVGGYTFESLIRSGVENIIIIDNDYIDKTNLNRQILSLESNVGQIKVNVAKARAKEINNQCNVETLNLFLSEDNINILDNYSIDYIVDCCDTIKTKVALINYAIKHNIKIISCMGSGKRLDATKITITTLDKTKYDPLARILRKKLKAENLSLKIPVVSSIEPPKKIDGEIVASCSYVPAVFGLYITNFIINDILKASK